MATKTRNTIRAAYIRKYSDTGQVQAIIDWSDESRTTGDPLNAHMEALLKRAMREGVEIIADTF